MMNDRKSSLPISKSEKLLPKSFYSSPILSLGVDGKRKLISSCSKINSPEHCNFLVQPHSFPGSNLNIERNLESSHTSNSLCSSEKSNSTQSITDTLLKVRRLTHVYDHDEVLIPNFVPSGDHLTIAKSKDIYIEEDVLKKNEEIQDDNSTKIGDKNFRLPTKAAAILGADDTFVYQSLFENSLKIQNTSFLNEKSVESKNKKPISGGEGESVDTFSKYVKSKRKIKIGSEMKEKLASFWKQYDQPFAMGFESVSTNYSSCTAQNANTSTCLQLKDMEKLLRVGKSSVEQFKSWSNSFECLLHDKYGLALFHEFLRSEFSDENIEFWIACEEYRTITNNKKLHNRAEKIYNDFVGVQAAREVNLDSKTRQQTESDIRSPTSHTFDQAQKRIQALMEKDSYQRFLRSELYGKLLRACEQYQTNQTKPTKDVTSKGPTAGILKITTQEISKLSVTPLKTFTTKLPTTVKDEENAKLFVEYKDDSPVNTVQPDEPSLPFSKSLLSFNPN